MSRKGRTPTLVLRLPLAQAQLDFLLEYTTPEQRSAALMALAESQAGGTMEQIAARNLLQEQFYTEYRRLTAELNDQNEMLLTVALPMSINADSMAVETFIVEHWRKPVTNENFREVDEAFRGWFRETYPEEYATVETAMFNRWR